MLVFDTLLQFMGILVALTLICSGWPLLGRALTALYGNLVSRPNFPTTRVGLVIIKIIRGAVAPWLVLPAPLMALLVIVLGVFSFIWLVGAHLIHPRLTVEVGGGLALLMCTQVGLCGVVTLSMLLLAWVSGVWQCTRFVSGAVFMGCVVVGVFFASDGFLLYYVAFSISTGACTPTPHLVIIVQRMWICLLLGLACFVTAPYREATGRARELGRDSRVLFIARRLFTRLAIFQGLCVVVGCCCVFGLVGWLELLVHLYSVCTPFVVDPVVIDTLMHHHIVQIYGVDSGVLWDVTYYLTLVGRGSFFI